VHIAVVRYHQILSATAGTALYSRFGGYSGGGAAKGEGRARASLAWFSWPTKAILQGNQKGPCVQAYAFTTITIYSWWRFSEPAY